jgi:hypothetical protein
MVGCSHTYTRADGSERRCPDPATETGRCGFHSVDWSDHFERADAEADAYSEATGGRNLFLDRMSGKAGRW